MSTSKTALFALLAMLSQFAWAATPSQTLEAFHAALAAGDAGAAQALLSPTVMIYESGYVERSRDEYASHHLASDIAFSKTTTRKVSSHQERIDGNVATVTEETETRGTFQGKPVKTAGLQTALLEKQGDAWIIVHLHWSSRKLK